MHAACCIGTQVSQFGSQLVSQLVILVSEMMHKAWGSGTPAPHIVFFGSIILRTYSVAVVPHFSIFGSANQAASGAVG